mgnify:CR=1 FL=1
MSDDKVGEWIATRLAFAIGVLALLNILGQVAHAQGWL